MGKVEERGEVARWERWGRGVRWQGGKARWGRGVRWQGGKGGGERSGSEVGGKGGGERRGGKVGKVGERCEVRIGLAESRSVRGASHQPIFMGDCLTICHTYLPCKCLCTSGAKWT